MLALLWGDPDAVYYYHGRYQCGVQQIKLDNQQPCVYILNLL